MVNTLSGSVCAYRKETVKPRFIRIDEVMALLDVTQDEAMDIALAAGARYQLAKIILVHKERLMKFMKHFARVPSSNKIVEKKFVRIGEASKTYSIGHHRFIEYLSVQAPLEKVNMLEDKQSKYIHEFVKRKEYSIVGKMRRNGFSQRDVDRQWNQIVNMIRKKQISGVVVANMAAISSSVADAYFKVGLVIEAGGIVVTVDEGRLDMHIKKGA